MSDMDQQLIDTLEILREDIGEPIIVDDGVRCVKNNEAVGGAAHSKHLPVSQAADIRTADLCALFTAAAKRFNGVGIYKNGSVHVDVGIRNYNPTFWYEDVPGHYTYFLDADKCLAAFKAL
jgi:uncharacterized protein YcbK (DUF882 family)